MTSNSEGYMVPNIKGWKLRMLRERDFTDIITG
jgi:hypothetical protein